MSKGNGEPFTLASNIEQNTKNTHIDTNQSTNSAVNQHSGQTAHATDSPASEVFPTLLKTMGEHREFTFFQYHIADLPVIIYDNKEGFQTYSSVERMTEAGKFTIDHQTHKLVRSSDHLPPTLDMSVTSMVVFQWIAMIFLIVVFFRVGSRYKRAPKKEPNGLQNLIETLVVFLRDEVVAPNIGGKHLTDRLLPYHIVLFFFILTLNFMGLLPGGHTPSGALGTTAALAICSFFLINLTHIKEIGLGKYLKHLLGGAPIWLSPIMIPIEILSMFTKPFALTVRLFANMTAGHVVLLSLVGLIFYFKSLALAPVSVAFSVFMYSLEILVGLLQAYIFTILTAVFIGLGVEHHDSEGHEKHSHA